MASYTNPQSLNRFAYVLNNPLRYTDPTGHKETACASQNDPDCSAVNGGSTGNTNAGGGYGDLKKKGKHGHDEGGDILRHNKDNDVTLPFSPTTSSSSPSWIKTAATVALITTGVVLIAGGLLFAGVGVGLLLAGGAGLAEVAAGAAGAAVAAESIQAITIGLPFLLPLAVGSTFLGGKAISEAVTP